jgi:hypothetical protein
MRIQVVLGLITIAVALGMSNGVCSAQPECDNVYFQLYDPLHDPPCEGVNMQVGSTIYVNSSPTSVSLGSCSGFTLDNLYTDVLLYEDHTGCAAGSSVTCDIVATGTLSGYYRITNSPGGGCFVVCATCTP